jgi:hypothetical protein
MALFEDEQKRVLIGVGIGLAAAGLIRELIPALRGVGRPLAKATIKSSLALIEKGREKAAELGEAFEDLVAEARAELDAEREGAGGEQAPPTQPETVN